MLHWVAEQLGFRHAVREARAAAAGEAGRTAAAPARDILLIPCWRRPEMLWHCVDNLCRAAGIEDLHVIFRPDSGYDADNLAVIHSFANRLASFEVQPAVPCPYRRAKLSANILLGYLHAAANTHRFVYLVEEDIMVARDFFCWHRAVHAQRPDLFCSIAVQNHNRAVMAPADPHYYYLSHRDYCSWGVCFDARVIGECLLPHVRASYFARPKRYLQQHFPASRIGSVYVEQAGLIRRVQESTARPIAYPAVPRAFHAGFYGRNRLGGVSGALGARVQQLRGVIYDRAAMRALAVSEAYVADSEPVSLEVDVAQRAALREFAVPWPS